MDDSGDLFENTKGAPNERELNACGMCDYIMAFSPVCNPSIQPKVNWSADS